MGFDSRHGDIVVCDSSNSQRQFTCQVVLDEEFPSVGGTTDAKERTEAMLGIAGRQVLKRPCGYSEASGQLDWGSGYITNVDLQCDTVALESNSRR